MDRETRHGGGFLSAGRYALLIATDRYEDSDLAPLIGPGTDAQELSDVLREPEIGAFEVDVRLNAPSDQLRRDVESFFVDRKRDDLLLLFLSCHGLKDASGSLYYATTDTNHRLLVSTSLRSSFVNDVMERSRSKCQVLILDCCFSGAFATGMRAKAGDKAISRQDFRLPGKGRGKVVLTASDSVQFAFEEAEGEEGGRGSLFTRWMVEGLRSGQADIDNDGLITPDNLHSYICQHLPPGSQSPEKWEFEVQEDLVIARNPHPVIVPATLSEKLVARMTDSDRAVRASAVFELEIRLGDSNPAIALAARNALERMATEDDSVRLRERAATVLRDEARGAALPADLEGVLQVEGFVRDAASGDGLGGARITLRIGPSKMAQMRSQPNGRFIFSSADDCTGLDLICKAELAGYQPREVHSIVSSSSTTVDVLLLPAEDA